MATGHINAGPITVYDGGTGAGNWTDARKFITGIYTTKGQAPNVSLTVPTGRYIMVVSRYSGELPYEATRAIIAIVGARRDANGTGNTPFYKGSSAPTITITQNSDRSQMTVAITSTTVWYDLMLIQMAENT